MIIKPRAFFRGVHPDGHKSPTAGLPAERLPRIAEAVIPLSQHAGAPAQPTSSAAAAARAKMRCFIKSLV